MPVGELELDKNEKPFSAFSVDIESGSTPGFIDHAIYTPETGKLAITSMNGDRCILRIPKAAR